MKIQIINKSKHLLPQYATLFSAGMDLRANLEKPITLKPLERCLVPTGLYIALPEGYEAQIRPRSGLALKKGITLLNTPGTIDADKWLFLAMSKLYGRKFKSSMKLNVEQVDSAILG